MPPICHRRPETIYLRKHHTTYGTSSTTSNNCFGIFAVFFEGFLVFLERCLNFSRGKIQIWNTPIHAFRQGVKMRDVGVLSTWKTHLFEIFSGIFGAFFLCLGLKMPGKMEIKRTHITCSRCMTQHTQTIYLSNFICYFHYTLTLTRVHFLHFWPTIFIDSGLGRCLTIIHRLH